MFTFQISFSLGESHQVRPKNIYSYFSLKQYISIYVFIQSDKTIPNLIDKQDKQRYYLQGRNTSFIKRDTPTWSLNISVLYNNTPISGLDMFLLKCSAKQNSTIRVHFNIIYFISVLFGQKRKRTRSRIKSVFPEFKSYATKPNVTSISTFLTPTIRRNIDCASNHIRIDELFEP